MVVPSKLSIIRKVAVLARVRSTIALRCEENTVRRKWKSPQLVLYNIFDLFYYESRKRELKRKPLYECRCDERLKSKSEKSTRLSYTGLFGELEHLKIKKRLIDEKFPSVMGEYVFLK